MARENNKYISMNLTVDQAARVKKLSERCGMPLNALMRLIAEKMTVADVERLAER